MTRQGRAIPRQTPTGLSGRRAYGARGWVTVLVLLAFVLQSLVIQTHIHQLVQPVAASSVPAPAPLKSQNPIDQCRLCQELVHAGTFVTPSASFAVATAHRGRLHRPAICPGFAGDGVRRRAAPHRAASSLARSRLAQGSAITKTKPHIGPCPTA